MDKQIITDGTSSMYISKQTALKIELHINKLINRDYWLEIGDSLYNFHAKNIKTTIVVNKTQFNILNDCIIKLNKL